MPQQSTPFPIAHASAATWTEALAACIVKLQPIPSDAAFGFLFVTDGFADHFDAIIGGLQAETGIQHWVGTVGIGIAATGQEYFDMPAIAIMPVTIAAEHIRLFGGQQQIPFPPFPAAVDNLLGPGTALAVVHADPRSEKLLPWLASLADQVFAVGALSSSRHGYGHWSGDLFQRQWSGVVLHPDVAVTTALTQGCSLIGSAHRVTAAEGNILFELDGKPALSVLKEDIGEVLSRDLRRIAGYIFAALPVAGSDTGDYLVRNLVGIDPENDLLAIGEVVENGDTVLFCRRDQQTAVADLKRMLEGLKRRITTPPRGALFHSCLSRGPNMFTGSESETALIRHYLGDIPLVGMFGNGEISNNRLYSYTGVLTLFL